MSGAIGVAAVAAVAGFAAVALLRDAIVGFFSSIRRWREQRAEQEREMQKVAMSVDPNWEGYTREDLEWTAVVGMTVKVTLENHSDQLIRNVRVAMHKRPAGVDSGKMLPALPPGQSANVEISRDQGLDPDDRPFVKKKSLAGLTFTGLKRDSRTPESMRGVSTPRDEVHTVERESVSTT